MNKAGTLFYIIREQKMFLIDQGSIVKILLGKYDTRIRNC